MIINWYQTVKGNSPAVAAFLVRFKFVQKGIDEVIELEQDKYNKTMEELRATNYSNLCRDNPERKRYEEMGISHYRRRMRCLAEVAEDTMLWGGVLYEVFDIEFEKVTQNWKRYALKEEARKTVAAELFPVVDAAEEFFGCGYGENHPVIAAIRSFASRRESEDQKMNLKAFIDIWKIAFLGVDAAIEYDNKLKEATSPGDVKITDWKPAKTLEELQNIAKAFDTIDCGKFADYYELFEAAKALPNL